MNDNVEISSVAIVGLGLIGSEWANHLNLDGILTATWNRSSKVDAPKFEASLEVIPSKASIIHIAVSDEIALLNVLHNLAPKLSSSNTVIQSTTIDADSSDLAKQLVEKCGARYIEAPFTGSLPAARERKTIFFLGGDSSLVEQVAPYLTHLSQAHFRIGSNRQACTIKLSMNLQIASAMNAIAEALAICRAANISDELFFNVFRQNASYSGVAALKEKKIISADFSPQFSVKHMAKDLRLLEKNRELTLPLLATVANTLRTAEQSGLGEEDFSAIVKCVVNSA